MPVGSLLPFSVAPLGSGSGAGGGPGGSTPGGGVSGLHWLGPAGRKLSGFRLTEKFVLLLVFSGFITLCFGAIFFLPDSPKLLSGVLFQHHQPPSAQRSPLGPTDQEDGGRLARIREEHERALREAKDTLNRPIEEIPRDIQRDKERLLAQGRVTAGAKLVPRPFKEPIGAVGGEPSDPAVKEKRDKIKETENFSTRKVIQLHKRNSTKISACLLLFRNFHFQIKVTACYLALKSAPAYTF